MLLEALITLSRAAIGISGLLLIAWAVSSNRWAVNWRIPIAGIIAHLLLALFVLKTDSGNWLFYQVGQFFVLLIGFTQAGTAFVFGPFADSDQFGFSVVLSVLPTIVFFSSLMAVAYHLGLMQWLVRGLATIIVRLMRVSGAEALSVAANVFVGQTEAPLVVRPYIPKMTESELFTLMCGGMATIAGGVLAAYVGVLGGGDPEAQAQVAKHLIAASLMAAPATFVMAKIMVPETGNPETLGTVHTTVARTTHNVIEAAAVGAADGAKLAINVGAMLLAFLALLALINYPLQWFGQWIQFPGTLDLALLLGYLMAPLAWLVGVPSENVIEVGGLIGQKIVANEFVAYIQLAELQGLSDKAYLIATYALCGFANIGSVAVQIGGIGGMAPERRTDVSRLGLRAVLGGTLATLMSATVAGALAT
ncbi:MAG: nucleoside transporter [Lysobacteraceae bacterium]|nr:MAG: nucleoside transporter [Xanthomonadaceae bacterium]